MATMDQVVSEINSATGYISSQLALGLAGFDVNGLKQSMANSVYTMINQIASVKAGVGVPSAEAQKVCEAVGKSSFTDEQKLEILGPKYLCTVVAGKKDP